MIHYEQICDDLTRAQRTIRLSMHSECSTEAEKEALYGAIMRYFFDGEEDHLGKAE